MWQAMQRNFEDKCEWKRWTDTESCCKGHWWIIRQRSSDHKLNCWMWWHTDLRSTYGKTLSNAKHIVQWRIYIDFSSLLRNQYVITILRMRPTFCLLQKKMQFARWPRLDNERSLKLVCNALKTTDVMQTKLAIGERTTEWSDADFQKWMRLYLRCEHFSQLARTFAKENCSTFFLQSPVCYLSGA